jgi:[acyl-carrier-protein] S-malonyltransferase
MTENTQPALMTTSIAIVKVLEQETGKKIPDLCKFVAGHSLGEYSALCAAGSISLSDCAKLLRIRGNAMQSACPLGTGAMAAIIGLPIGELEIITSSCPAGRVSIANDNSLDQIVISGDINAIDYIIGLMKDLGKKAIKLNVSAPFHSTLMQPAAKRMQEALDKINILEPLAPNIANVTADKVLDAPKIRNNLVHQVTGRVRWRETMDYLNHNSIEGIIEIGAGKVLSNLAKRSAHNFRFTSSINSCDDMKEFIKML